MAHQTSHILELFGTYQANQIKIPQSLREFKKSYKKLSIFFHPDKMSHHNSSLGANQPHNGQKHPYFQPQHLTMEFINTLKDWLENHLKLLTVENEQKNHPAENQSQKNHSAENQSQKNHSTKNQSQQNSPAQNQVDQFNRATNDSFIPKLYENFQIKLLNYEIYCLEVLEKLSKSSENSTNSNSVDSGRNFWLIIIQNLEEFEKITNLIRFQHKKTNFHSFEKVRENYQGTSDNNLKYQSTNFDKLFKEFDKIFDDSLKGGSNTNQTKPVDKSYEGKPVDKSYEGKPDDNFNKHSETLNKSFNFPNESNNSSTDQNAETKENGGNYEYLDEIGELVSQGVSNFAKKFGFNKIGKKIGTKFKKKFGFGRDENDKKPSKIDDKIK